MQTISCDSCRKPIKSAMRDVNYVVMLDKEMCIPCKEDFEVSVTKSMRSKRKYVFLEGKKILTDMLYKMCR